MKDLLRDFVQALKATDLATRIVVGASVALLVGIVAVVSVFAGRPHMVPLHTGLDDAQFNAVTRALATAGVRFEASSPPGPYSVFVDQAERYTAQNAVSVEGALDLGPRGIPSGAGSSSIFLGKDERDQINLKRNWQELEHQLRALSFVKDAVVRISPGLRSPLLRRTPATVSVLITLREVEYLSRQQRTTLASIVRNSTNVPDENITISDQHGNSLFDGTRDEGLDAALQFERDFATSETRRAQEYLDRVFGPGMAAVSVIGEWDHDRREEVDETYDPTKFKLDESTSETRTPVEAVAGGPAGIASNIDSGTAGAAPARAEPPVAETLDSQARYTYGTRTTHRVQVAPTLLRLAVTLTLDSSLGDRLTEAQALVEDLVGFQEERDQITATALPLAGVERDAEGNPVPATVEPLPAPPNSTLTLLMERGVEILAALTFLFVLLRSLRRAKPTAAETAGAASAGAEVHEEEVDLEALARRQIEQLVQDDPERVGVLLSRWALGEIPYSNSTR